LKIDIRAVQDAREFLKTHVENTPLRRTRCLPGDVFIKCENLQRTGSFKIRGALNRMRSLTDAEKKKGVIASSAGNHAQGVALSAKLYNVPATIVMPQTAPMIKVLATQNYGAKVILEGEYYDQAFEAATRMAKEQGQFFLHPYMDPYVIAGQGTIGLEILDEVPDLEQIIVPIGGGGLIGGISTVIKARNPKCEVIGVVSDQAPGMKEFKDGHTPEPHRRVATIADGIAVKQPSREMFENYIKTNVDRVVSVSDNEIAEAIVNLMEKDKMIVEGSGAVGIAAVMAGRFLLKNKSAIVLSGGNIDVNTMYAVIETGLRHKGRLTRISVIVSDLPGELSRLTAILAKHRANVLDVIHDRVSPELAVRETRIDFLLETSSFDHAKELEQKLKAEGVRLIGEHK
jgi:threonine dehydratase